MKNPLKPAALILAIAFALTACGGGKPTPEPTPVAVAEAAPTAEPAATPVQTAAEPAPEPTVELVAAPPAPSELPHALPDKAAIEAFKAAGVGYLGTSVDYLYTMFSFTTEINLQAMDDILWENFTGESAVPLSDEKIALLLAEFAAHPQNASPTFWEMSLDDAVGALIAQTGTTNGYTLADLEIACARTLDTPGYAFPKPGDAFAAAPETAAPQPAALSNLYALDASPHALPGKADVEAYKSTGVAYLGTPLDVIQNGVYKLNKPFTLEDTDDYMYGRGVIEDKTPVTDGQIALLLAEYTAHPRNGKSTF